MTNKYEETVAALEQRMLEVMSKFRSLKKENAELKKDLEHRHNDLKQAHHDLLTLQENYEQLRIARHLATSEDERNTAKRNITKLVREIDKCLTLLSNH